MLIPSIDFGGQGAQIHFAHANGFHPRMYQDLIADLTPHYKVDGTLFRPYWSNDHMILKSWELLSDDLIKYFDQQGFKNVLGIGHSMGAIASVLAMSKRPDLFSKLILLDPVILQPKYYLSRFLPLSLKKKFIPIAQIALKRRDRWESKEAAYNQLRSKKVFSQIPEHVFRDYINYGTQEHDDGGVTLSYSKEWEAQVYMNSANPWPALKKLQIPVMIVRGKQSNVLVDKSWALIKSKLSSFSYEEIEDGGHLVPFEKKSKISKLILDFI